LPKYLPDLTTLEHVLSPQGIADADDGDNPMLIRYIHEVSAWFQRRCDRVFVPYFDSESHDARGDDVTARTLNVKDLLEVGSIVNGDGTTVAANQYVLRERNTYPKWRVELLGSSGVAWTYTDDWQDAITLHGTLGVHDNYPQAFRTMTQLNGSLTAVATTAYVDSDEYLETLQYVRFGGAGGELAQITRRNGNGTLTLERGVLGTTAVEQADNTTLQAYQENPDVQLAVTRLVSYLYDNRDNPSGRVAFADGSTITEVGIPSLVTDTVKERQWLEMRR